jgi:hypothetical protein
MRFKWALEEVFRSIFDWLFGFKVLLDTDDPRFDDVGHVYAPLLVLVQDELYKVDDKHGSDDS